MNAPRIADRTTRKIGRNRGKPRLWLEGAVLQTAGFTHGERFDIIHTPGLGMFTIEADPDGKRKVSGSADRPVIDTLAGGLGEVAKAATVSICYVPGSGIIEVTGLTWKEAV